MAKMKLTKCSELTDTAFVTLCFPKGTNEIQTCNQTAQEFCYHLVIFYKKCKPLVIALCFCYLLDFMMDVLWLWDMKTARASDKSVEAQGSNLAVGKI